MDGWHAKCSGILNAAQYRRKSDWTCDAYSAPHSQQSPPPTRSPAPPTKQISDDSTFNVLQLNANGIGNTLTELEVVLERNKVKVAVIQESKLSPKSKNPCTGLITILTQAFTIRTLITFFLVYNIVIDCIAHHTKWLHSRIGVPTHSLFSNIYI